EVEHAFAEREEHVRHGVDGERRERGRMDRRLDHDLVGAYTVHPVEEPLARRLELPFDPEHGELVGQDPVRPAGPVRADLLAPTSWQMGMLTPWRRASASAEVTVRTPSATMRVRSSTAATVSPRVSAMPSWRLRERLPVHVRTRSPKPASPARVAGIAPSAT